MYPQQVVVDLGTAGIQDQPSQSTLELTKVLSLDEAEEGHMEFTEEQTAPEEVQVSLGEAERKEAEPSLVGTQEQVVEPQAAEHLETEDVSTSTI